MSILNWKIEFPDQALDANAEQTRLGRLACNDSLGDITTPGYLNQIVTNPDNQGNVPTNAAGYQPLPQDFWFIYFNGGSGQFSVSIDGDGIITLVAANLNAGMASVAVSAAQFLGMYAAPVELLPAPGANKLIIVDRMELVMTYGAANYAAGGVVAAQYDSTINGAGVKATNTEAAADYTGAGASTTFQFNGGVNVLPFSTTVNKGLYLSNASAAFTTGDSDFVVNVHYHVISVA